MKTPTEQQARKRIIRTFLREHAGDVQLAALLAECRDEKFNYGQPSHCLIGIIGGGILSGYAKLMSLPTSSSAGPACYGLANPGDNAGRSRVLIVMARAEMRRRELLREPQQTEAKQTYAEAMRELGLIR